MRRAAWELGLYLPSIANLRNLQSMKFVTISCLLVIVNVAVVECTQTCAARAGGGACLCAAGEFQETRVLISPKDKTSVSASHYAGGLPYDNILLDGVLFPECWATLTGGTRQWVQFDTGVPMEIVGIITQGRPLYLEHHVKSFIVEYRLGNLDANIDSGHTFTMLNGDKKEHTFSTPIYARYVRILPQTWGDLKALRAALVVRTCSKCLPGQVSLAGSVSVDACQCTANSFLDPPSVATNRGIALLPWTAQLSTLARRSLRTYAATAVFDSAVAAGPPTGRGAVTFDRALMQSLDGRAHTFNIATNLGFTAVAVVRFSGTAASNERIFDFGSAANNNNIILQRQAATNFLRFSIFNAGTTTCALVSAAVLPQDTWVTVVAIYTASNRFMELRIGGVSAPPTACAVAAGNRIVDNTNVGKDVATANYLTGSVAGLYAVDAVLPEAEIAVIIARMHRGEDPLEACTACPSQNAASAQGSVGESSCHCAAGQFSDLQELPCTEPELVPYGMAVNSKCTEFIRIWRSQCVAYGACESCSWRQTSSATCSCTTMWATATPRWRS